MNKLSISINCTSLLPIPQRLEYIKRAGFDSVMLDTFNFNEATFNENVELSRKNNLSIDSVHMDFEGINELWTENGEKLFNSLSSQIQAIGKAGIDKAIIHISSGFNPPTISPVGLTRIDNLRKIASKYNVTLCLENLRLTSYIDEIISHIGNNGLGLCYDSGHENLYNKGQCVAEHFINKLPLVAIHLHDNFGNNDDHNLPFDGNINWQIVVNQLRACNYTGALNIEPIHMQSGLYKNETPYNFINLAYERLILIKQLFEKD